MALITWNDNLSVKVAEIDQQHQKLVKMINELGDAMKQGKGKDVIGNIINGLITYTATHFKTEEKYFFKFEYSGTDRHIKEHNAFVEKVANFRKDFEQGKLALSVDIMNFLSDWLKNHINTTDKKYTQCFNENGLR